MSYADSHEIPGAAEEAVVSRAASEAALADWSSEAEEPLSHWDTTDQYAPTEQTFIQSTPVSARTQTSSESRTSTRSPEDIARRNRNVRRAVRGSFAGLVVLASAGIAYALWPSGSNNKPKLTGAYVSAIAECKTTDIGSLVYSNSEEVLPTNEVSDSSTAGNYTRGLFKNGPLNKPTTLGILAFETTITGGPAFGHGLSTEANLSSAFSSNLASLKASPENIVKACAEDEVTMDSTFTDENVAIAAGSPVTQVVPVEKNGVIVGEEIDQYNAPANIGGIVYNFNVLNSNPNDLQTFYTVVVAANGQEYLMNYPVSSDKSLSVAPRSTTTSTATSPRTTSHGGGAYQGHVTGGAGSGVHGQTSGGNNREGTQCVVGEPCTPGAPVSTTHGPGTTTTTSTPESTTTSTTETSPTTTTTTSPPPSTTTTVPEKAPDPTCDPNIETCPTS